MNAVQLGFWLLATTWVWLGIWWIMRPASSRPVRILNWTAGIVLVAGGMMMLVLAAGS